MRACPETHLRATTTFDTSRTTPTKPCSAPGDRGPRRGRHRAEAGRVVDRPSTLHSRSVQWLSWAWADSCGHWFGRRFDGPAHSVAIAGSCLGTTRSTTLSLGRQLHLEDHVATSHRARPRRHDGRPRHGRGTKRTVAGDEGATGRVCEVWLRALHAEADLVGDQDRFRPLIEEPRRGCDPAAAGDFFVSSENPHVGPS